MKGGGVDVEESVVARGGSRELLSRRVGVLGQETFEGGFLRVDLGDLLRVGDNSKELLVGF